MTTWNGVVTSGADRYAQSSRLERRRILDEFAGVTGHHGKHALRLLREAAVGAVRTLGPRLRAAMRRSYCGRLPIGSGASSPDRYC